MVPDWNSMDALVFGAIPPALSLDALTLMATDGRIPPMPSLSNRLSGSTSTVMDLETTLMATKQMNAPRLLVCSKAQCQSVVKPVLVVDLSMTLTTMVILSQMNKTHVRTPTQDSRSIKQDVLTTNSMTTKMA